MSSQELIIRIAANAKQFQTELDKVKKKTEDLQDTLATATKISGVAFAALTGTIAGTVMAAGNFEKTFSSAVTQLDKTSFSTKTLEKGIEDLRKDVISLGINSGESFEVLNTGLFDLLSAGVPAEQAMEALTAASELASAGASDTATSVKALISAMTSYGEAAGSAQTIAEAFYAASKTGVTDVAGLAENFNKVAGTARTLGISFEEALASGAALTNNGATPAKVAFTGLDAVLNSVIAAQGKLATQSKEVQEALSIENIQRVGLNQALRQTVTAMGGNVTALQNLLGSSNALAAVLSLTGAQAKDVDKILSDLGDTTGRTQTFQDALRVKTETLDAAFNRVKRSLEAAAITLGEKFVPIIIATSDFVAKLAAKFSDLDPWTVRLLAGFLGLATALTGMVTAGALAASAFLSIRNAILALQVTFGAARVAAAAFWGAATLGVSVLIMALPTIIDYVKDLVGWFKKLGDDPKGLENVNAELERMKKLREDIANDRSAVNFGDKKDDQLAKIDEKIAKLEQLKQKELEVKAVQDGNAPEQKQEAPAANNEALKVKDEETKKRIALAEMEADKLRAIRDNVAQEEIDFERRKAELKQAGYEAGKIIDAEERALALENIRMQNEQLLLEEQEYQQKRAEVLLLAREQQAILDEEYRALDDETRAALRQKDLDELNAQVMTEEQIRNEAAKKKLKQKIEERNQFLRDEQKFGTTYAQLQQLLNSEQLAMAQQAANALIGMQQSKNNTLKTIGKAAGLTQLGIDTATTAMSAYSAMAGIPIVGPALGAAAAAAVIAYGAERASMILAANEGGIVPNVPGSIRGVDSVPASLTPGELVVPAQNFEEVVDSVAASRSGGGAGNMSGGSVIIQGDFYGEETFIDKIAERLFEAQRTRNVQLVP